MDKNQIEESGSRITNTLNRTIQEGGKQIREKAHSMRESATEALDEVRTAAARGARRGTKARELHEGRVTKMIESFTARVPSGTYLGLALGAMAASAVLRTAGRKEDANFVGEWVPTILIMGLYNKLVRLQGSE
jgi:ElaB/YqjD/DUF883 family membrane-anchored ribosome-binding protein